MPYLWQDSLTESEREIIRQGGYGQSRPLGQRPAVVVIDGQVNYVGENRPTLEQIDKYPSGVGQAAWQALPAILKLLAAARLKRVPVIYTLMRQSKVQQRDGVEALGFYNNVKRNERFMTEDDPGQNIVSELAPEPERGDLLLYKDQPSAFFGTPLISYLLKWKVDTLLLTGGTTSGCVRATAVDAASLNLCVAVIEDAVFDRISFSHKASLLDIWMKYGNVLDVEEALGYLAEVAA